MMISATITNTIKSFAGLSTANIPTETASPRNGTYALRSNVNKELESDKKTSFSSNRPSPSPLSLSTAGRKTTRREKITSKPAPKVASVTPNSQASPSAARNNSKKRNAVSSTKSLAPSTDGDTKTTASPTLSLRSLPLCSSKRVKSTSSSKTKATTSNVIVNCNTSNPVTTSMSTQTSLELDLEVQRDALNNELIDTKNKLSSSLHENSMLIDEITILKEEIRVLNEKLHYVNKVEDTSNLSKNSLTKKNKMLLDQIDTLKNDLSKVNSDNYSLQKANRGILKQLKSKKPKQSLKLEFSLRNTFIFKKFRNTGYSTAFQQVVLNVDRLNQLKEESAKARKGKKKIIILGDSHSRNFAKHLRLNSTNFAIESYVHPGAGSNKILASANFPDLSKNDCVLILSGSNDVYKISSRNHDSISAANHPIISFAARHKHTNVIVSAVPYRRDKAPSDPMNQQIYDFNLSLFDLGQKYENCTFFNRMCFAIGNDYCKDGLHVKDNFKRLMALELTSFLNFHLN